MTESERTRLPAGLLASLYKSSLVGGAPSPAMDAEAGNPSVETQSAEKTSLGGYGRSVLLLVDHAGDPFMPEAELTFLTNILKACRLGMEDVMIANIHGMSAEDRKSLLEDRKPHNLILFGVEPAEIALPISFPPLKVQRHGPSQYLHAPSLQALQGDDTAKRGLWASLKSMFGI
jgi:hypothetical protein